MRGAKRMLFALALGGILAGAIAGLAVVLVNARSHSRSDLERSAQERPALAAALIDSIFGASDTPSAQAPISGRRVTSADVRAMGAQSFTAVLGQNGRLLASWPPAQRSTVRLLTTSPVVASARTGHNALSNLMPATGSIPAGFVSASAYRTAYGPRVLVSRFPLAGITGVLQQYLDYVAHFSRARVYLVDDNNRVLGANSGPTAIAKPLGDSALLAALKRNGTAGHYDGGAFYYAVGRLKVAPWRVIYAVPSGVLYASNGSTWSLSFILLAAFAGAAAVCLILLVRLFSRSDQLTRANLELGERNTEIERANQAKSQFLANMSHELRTPLGSIIGFAELMRSERHGDLSDQHREFLTDISSSAHHLLGLINEVLDLARIESGRITLNAEPIDPAVVAADCVDGMRAVAAEREIGLTLEVRPVGIVSLDPARLRQVLLNYVSNGIKFTPEGGNVAVRVGARNGDLLIEVSDTGAGIAAADQERVFGEFEQVRRQGGHHPGGTGLGLAVTKRIVEAQGGEVGVQSRQGRGSTFYARIPLQGRIVGASVGAAKPTAPVQPEVPVAEGR
jgi:signal transduction histidine kinase